MIDQYEVAAIMWYVTPMIANAEQGALDHLCFFLFRC